MTRKMIDDFLAKHEGTARQIKRISENYSISDFVKVTESVRGYFQNDDSVNVEGIYGCIYDIRRRDLRLYVESVEQRLTKEYLDYLIDIIKDDEEIDRVFYIVAYHYLSLCKQLGFDLTATQKDNVPFPVWGEEMSPLAKDNYEKIKKLHTERVHRLIPYFSKEDIMYYSDVYQNCGYSHHAVKYFSLIELLVGFNSIVGRMNYDYEFEKILDVFVFRYRAIFTGERLHIYLAREEKSKVISNLVDI